MIDFRLFLSKMSMMRDVIELFVKEVEILSQRMTEYCNAII